MQTYGKIYWDISLPRPVVVFKKRNLFQFWNMYVLSLFGSYPWICYSIWALCMWVKGANWTSNGIPFVMIYTCTHQFNRHFLYSAWVSNKCKFHLNWMVFSSICSYLFRTKRNLHSHSTHPAPVSKRHFQVTCYGEVSNLYHACLFVFSILSRRFLMVCK